MFTIQWDLVEMFASLGGEDDFEAHTWAAVSVFCVHAAGWAFFLLCFCCIRNGYLRGRECSQLSVRLSGLRPFAPP